MKSKQTRRQKREEKNFEAPSPVELVNDKAKDKQIKRIKKKRRKLNKKKSREAISIKKIVTQGFRKIKAACDHEERKSALKNFAKQYTIDRVKGYDP